MQGWIIDTINGYGYLAIILLIALENIFPPIPSEIILAFGGYATTLKDSNLKVWGVIIAATLGSLIGAIALYGVGRLLPAERLAKWLNGRVGKILHLDKDDVYKAEKWFNNKGKSTVLICRCIPIVRSLISVPAGMAKMPLGIFFIFTTIGSLTWNTILVYLGCGAGAAWERIMAGTDIYTKITVFVIGLICVVLAGIWLKKIIKDRENKKKDI